jgi:hypothetical protein
MLETRSGPANIRCFSAMNLVYEILMADGHRVPTIFKNNCSLVIDSPGSPADKCASHPYSPCTRSLNCSDTLQTRTAIDLRRCLRGP